MTTNIGSLAVSLSMDASRFNGSLTQVDRNLRAMRSELTAVRARGTAYGNSLEGLNSRQDILRRSLSAANIKLTETRRRYDEMVASGTASEAQLERQARRVNDAQAHYNRLETELNEVNAALRTQTSSWHQLSERLAPIGARLTSIGQGMTNIGRNLSMHVTAPLVAMGTGAFKAAVDFESAFAGVRKTVDATEEEFAKLEKGIRDMAKAGPSSASELASIAEAAGQLGIANENILTFTSTMSDLGTATNMTSEQAATSLARLANITQMPQSEFDRLGSTIVALGNNLATTESEITEFGLRIAGAGAQVGLTEAQILAIGGALSSVGINAEAGGTAISKVMIDLANAVAIGGKDLEKFSKVAGMSSKDFKIAFEQDAAGAIVSFVEGLGRMSKSGENVFAVMEDLGLSEVRVRDALLRASGAGDLLRNSLDLGTKAWNENNALTKEASERYKTTASQMKTLWNQVVDVGISLGNVLIPKVQKLMDKLKPLIERFANMSEESQNLVLKIGGIVAAIGPLLVVGGALMSGLGGTITVISSLSGAIAGAGGLTAAITALAGPVGWITAGLGLAAVATVGLIKATKEKNEVSVDSIDKSYEAIKAQQAEIKSNEELIKNFESLKQKSNLTTSEMKRFLDINSELAVTASPERIAALHVEQGKLLEKSGLTNEEMNTFLAYNDEIIKKAPNTTKAITDQGNAYALNTQELQKVNSEKLKSLKIDAEQAINSGLEKEASLLKEKKELVQAINDKEKERKDTYQNINGYLFKINQIETEIKELKKDDSPRAQAMLEARKQELLDLQGKLILEEASLDKILAQQKYNNENLGILEKDLKKLDEQKYKYEEIILATVGLNSEKGKGLATVQTEIQKLDTQKASLRALHESGKLNTAEYQAQVGKIDQQIGRLKAAQTELENVNAVAGRTIYKSIQISTNPSIEEFERRITKPGTKVLNITTSGGGRALGGYATGTRYAPGGPALVGELGRELIHMDGYMYLATEPGIVNLPRGAKVIPNRDTEAILNKWHIPMLAKGGSVLSDGLAYIAERGRELVDLSGAGARTKPLSNVNQSTQRPVIIEIPIYLDSDEIGRGTSGVISNLQNSQYQTKLILNGVR